MSKLRRIRLRSPNGVPLVRVTFFPLIAVASITGVSIAQSTTGGTAVISPPSSLSRPSAGGAASGNTPSASSGATTTTDPPRRLPTADAFDPYSQENGGNPFTNLLNAFDDDDRQQPPDTVLIVPEGFEADDGYQDWRLQAMPRGLVYRSYLAGVKESRMASVFNYESDQGWLWEITLGGRVGLFRFGTTDAVRPEGFQIDAEGSAQPRLMLDRNQDLAAVDFRAGLPITYGVGRWQTKFAYYHLSSHVGDEFLLANPTFTRLNYSRDAFVLGESYYLTDDLRLYGELGWAFYSDISEPWELQFGVDYSPRRAPGIRGAPFAALNTHLRQEVNFGGNFTAQAGWQWRAPYRGQLLRIGVQYYNGKSNEYEFFNENENKVGFGVWYDY